MPRARLDRVRRGRRKGVVPEDTLDHKVDWRTEAELALQARRDVEAQSRRPEMLDDFMDKARRSTRAPVR